jgi:transcription elongation factor GreA
LWGSARGVSFFAKNSIMNNHTPITQFGLDELKAELTSLVDVKRPAVVTRLSIARSMGDLAENSDYISAREELSFLDGRVAELEEIIQNVKVTTPTKSDAVDFGHTVTVKVNDAAQADFKIVGQWEADPTQKKISYSSPLGQSLMGKKVGEKVEITVPAGKVIYTVISIKKASQ